jgi:hypothetical protein
MLQFASLNSFKNVKVKGLRKPKKGLRSKKLLGKPGT